MENVLQFILYMIPFLIYLYLFNIYAPHHRIKKADWMKGYMTHRGLFTVDQSIPENSLAAFKAAMEAGYGSELDVQCTQEGEVMVFHDDTLDRLCHVAGLLEDKTYDQIKSLKLALSEEPIPTLASVLELTQGKVPLMIEIKHTQRIKLTVSKVKACLENYQGNITICSFNPLILGEVKRQMPEVLRGQLMEPSLHKKQFPLYLRLILHFALMNGIHQPDYLSIHHQQRLFSYKVHRWMGGFGVMWPIQNASQATEAKKYSDLIIFEHYRPVD